MSYTIDLNNSQIKTIINTYQDYAVELTNNYTIFCLKYKSSTVTIYKTNKMLVQGSTAIEVYNEMLDILGLEKIKEEKINETLPISLSMIGTDEVGCGDFFGGIVVSGCYVHKSKIEALKKLGVKDSKELSDTKILEIAPTIMKEVKTFSYYLDPIKYNYITKTLDYNMNKIKSLMHNTVIYHLSSSVDDYDGIVIDAFTTKEKYLNYLGKSNNIIDNVNLEEKAESKYISVAAASIVARYKFIKAMEEISSLVGFEIPYGASSRVDVAIKKLIKERGEKFLTKIGKINFKNFEKSKL